jgi:hypothetical protein
MSRDALGLLAKDELFGDGQSRAGFSFTRSRGEPFLFGPKSGSKVKFPRGIRASRAKVRRIGELVAAGKSDYDIARIIAAEFPGRAPGWRIITKLRSVVESERGPTMCRCGRGINHVEDCSFKTPRVKRNRGLSIEGVRDIRANYGPGQHGKMTGIKLAQKWGISESAVSAVFKGRSHQCPSLKLAQYKTRMYIAQLEKVKHPIDRLREVRTLAAASSQDTAFNEELDYAGRLIDDAMQTLLEAAQIR